MSLKNACEIRIYLFHPISFLATTHTIISLLWILNLPKKNLLTFSFLLIHQFLQGLDPHLASNVHHLSQKQKSTQFLSSWNIIKNKLTLFPASFPNPNFYPPALPLSLITAMPSLRHLLNDPPWSSPAAFSVQLTVALLIVAVCAAVILESVPEFQHHMGGVEQFDGLRRWIFMMLALWNDFKVTLEALLAVF